MIIHFPHTVIPHLLNLLGITQLHMWPHAVSAFVETKIAASYCTVVHLAYTVINSRNFVTTAYLNQRHHYIYWSHSPFPSKPALAQQSQQSITTSKPNEPSHCLHQDHHQQTQRVLSSAWRNSPALWANENGRSNTSLVGCTHVLQSNAPHTVLADTHWSRARQYAW